MDELRKSLLLLIKSALTGEKCALPDNLDYQKICVMARTHGVSALVYYGAHNSGINVNREPFLALFSSVCGETMLSEKQLFELKRIENAFAAQSIDYMPLKGARLKSIYPKHEMRCMSDLDILIKLEQYPIITTIMEKLGYAHEVESDHELIWKKENIKVELHKRLIPSYNEDYYAYFGDGWNLARKVADSTRYKMSREDEFVFIFTHLCKHYRDSGIGLKHLIDIWVYKRAYQGLDFGYIKRELNQLKIYEFYKNVIKTVEVWFEGKCDDEKTAYITDVAFNNGEFLRKDAKVLSAALKEVNSGKSVKQIKRKRFFNTVFVPYKYMRDYYPVLKKLPILLPFAWVYHLFKRLFTKGRLKKYHKEMEAIKQNEVELYKKSLNFVGLDYNFGEQKSANSGDKK